MTDLETIARNLAADAQRHAPPRTMVPGWWLLPAVALGGLLWSLAIFAAISLLSTC